MTNQSEFKDTPSTEEKKFMGKGNKEINSERERFTERSLRRPHQPTKGTLSLCLERCRQKVGSRSFEFSRHRESELAAVERQMPDKTVKD